MPLSTQSSPEMFDEQFNVNVRGAYFTAKHAVPLIADGGAILFTASMVTSIAEPMSSVYSATKAALRSFGRSLASELAPKIRVNTDQPWANRNTDLREARFAFRCDSRLLPRTCSRETP